jgi:hypothetical protein
LFSLKRYADAVAPLETCVEQLPTAPYCLRYQIANFAYLDQLENAKWVAEEYEILGFDLNIHAIIKAANVKVPHYRAHFRKGLVKAGLPE